MATAMTRASAPACAKAAIAIALLALVWGGLGAERAEAGGYAKLLPAKHACKHQRQAKGSERDLRKAMRCLVDKVRKRHGRHGADAKRSLSRAAEQKAGDIRRCNSFSHNACGRSWYYWPQHYGYADGSRWSLGENIAWGTDGRRSPRNTMRRWLNSSPHRAVLFKRSFRHVGVGLSRGRFNGKGNAAVWVLYMGCHC